MRISRRKPPTFSGRRQWMIVDENNRMRKFYLEEIKRKDQQGKATARSKMKGKEYPQ